MRPYFPTILAIASLLAAPSAFPQETPVPPPAGDLFPNIKASINDGFYVLAEQQTRGVLATGPKSDAEREAVLLLAHALWGEKRYTEMLDLLDRYDGEPDFVYWRARANFELRRYDKALQLLAGAQMGSSRYAPAAFRLRGHIEKLLGRLDQAADDLMEFQRRFPNDGGRIDNAFELAEVYRLQKKLPEALAVLADIAAGPDKAAARRAQLRQAHLLYTLGSDEDIGRARGLLAALASDEQARLALRIDAWVDLSALEERAGRPDDAESALRKAVALSPVAAQRVPLKLSLARMLLRYGDAAGALKLIEEGRAEAPNETVAAELQLEKASALLADRQYGPANDAFQIYLEVSGNAIGQARASFGKGLCLWELKRYAEAAAAFDKAYALHSAPQDRAAALFKAGDAYYETQNYVEAEKRYRNFATDYPESPILPNALYQLGLALMKSGRTPDALSTFQSIETRFPGTPFAEEAALRAADIMLAGDDREGALAKYAAIAQSCTNRATVSFSLRQSGLVLYDLGRFAEAQKLFEQVFADYPESAYAPQASYMRGFCLFMQGQVDEAFTTCQAFIDKYPNSEWTPEVVFRMAEQYYNQGNYAEADPLFMRIATDYRSSRFAPRALYWAGRVSAARANYVQAIERYAAVAKDFPDSDVMPQTRFAQGDALSELGEFARAILAFDELIKTYPDNPLVNAAWGRKGDCQFSLAVDNPARYAEALASYQVILDRPSAPAALRLQAEYKVGRCLEKTNASDKAFSHYMNVVYTYLNEDAGRSPDAILWFTRAAFGAAAIKEKEKAWVDAVQIYRRVVEAGVPAKEEAGKRIEAIIKDNWLLFQRPEETAHVGTNG